MAAQTPDQILQLQGFWEAERSLPSHKSHMAGGDRLYQTRYYHHAQAPIGNPISHIQLLEHTILRRLSHGQPMYMIHLKHYVQPKEPNPLYPLLPHQLFGMNWKISSQEYIGLN